MNFKYSIFFIICFTCITHSLFSTLSVSQYAPETFFQKPYFDQKYFTHISTIFSAGYAHQAFNQYSKKVPFMQQFGSEDFLYKFVNPLLNPDDTSSAGKGLLSGNFQYRQAMFSVYKNIFNHIFIEAATVIQDLTITSIAAQYSPTTTIITPEQIEYLEQLQTKLPFSINRSGMFTTAMYIGFNKTFDQFAHLDFVDILFKVGIATPEAMYDSHESIVQFPFNQNFNFGYPFIGSISVGLLDWMTIGVNGTIEPFQPATKNIALNNTNSQNQLLLPEQGMALIDRGNLYSASIYCEADHIISGISASIGYSYTKNMAYRIQPLQTNHFSQTQANTLKILQPWSFGALYIQSSFDFAHELKPNAPLIEMFVMIPLAGTLSPQTNIYNGACNFQISYLF